MSTKKKSASEKSIEGTLENPHKIPTNDIFEEDFKPGYTVFYSVQSAYDTDKSFEKWNWEEYGVYPTEKKATNKRKSLINDDVEMEKRDREREYWNNDPNRHTISNLAKKITKDTTDAQIDAIVDEAKALREKLKITPVDKPFKFEGKKDFQALMAKHYRVVKRTIYVTDEILEVK